MQPKKEVKDKNLEKKYTDKDVDLIISKKIKAFEEKYEKKVNEAQKLANMDAEEKIKYERDRLKKELEDLKERQALNDMAKTARAMLSEKNINISDDLLSLLVSTDAKVTKSVIDNFADLYTSAVECGIKERLKAPLPKTGGKPTITKDDIFAIKDKNERIKKIRENIDLFEK